MQSFFNPVTQYDQMFSFIRKNKDLPDAIMAAEESKEDQDKLSMLLSAIATGDSQSAIFSDQNCHIYLLSLMKNNKIAYWQGMTIYLYLSVLMQFTDRQPVKDEHLKAPREVAIETLVKDENITPEGQFYLKKSCKTLNTYGLPDLYEELSQYVIKLPATERWLFKISHSTANIVCSDSIKSAWGFDHLSIFLQNANLPFIHIKKDDNEKSFLYCASFSLIHYCLQKSSKDPMKLRPIFGSISLSTLAHLHQNSEHPIPLYSTHVKSNLTAVHTIYFGPFCTMIHDLGHAFWGGLLPLTFRKNLYSFLIPEIRELLKVVKQNNDNEVATSLEAIIEACNDIDLATHSRTSEKERISRLFEIGFIKQKTSYSGNFKIGRTKYDVIYFLLTERFNQKSEAWDEDSKIFWKQLTDIAERYIHRELSDHINPGYNANIRESLKQLADKGNDNIPAIPDSVNKKVWLDLLESEQDNSGLWTRMVENHHQDFLLLAQQGSIKFFHPYLPLTEPKRQVLIETFQSAPRPTM